MTFQSFSDSKALDIPRQQGVYAFFLNLVSPSKVGLAGKGPWSDDVLERARTALINRCRRQAEILCAFSMTGMVADRQRIEHLSPTLHISARPNVPTSFIQELGELPLGCVREYVNLVHSSCVFNPPIYVGITTRQTLRERYEQHRSAFLSGPGDTSFGTRLRDAEIEWDDILFACIPFDKASDQVEILSTLERHLQALTKPVLSRK